MELLRTVSEMHDWSDAERRGGHTIALVPTMGALHDGHFALVEEAMRRSELVVVSIFVNPTQFGKGEDLDSYPRQLQDDLAALEEMGVDAVFAPNVEAMYPFGEENVLTWVTVERLDEHLCGRFRPGHFRGVTTVVLKLFNVCRPDVAVFGRKDAQQFVILKRMVEELLLDVEMVGVDIVREEDGLAMSSRNAYLDPEQRREATALYRAVTAGRRQLLEGEQRPGALVETMREKLLEAYGLDVQYAEVVDARTLQPIDSITPGQPVLLAVAAFLGKTRLIDNAFAEAPATTA